MAGVAELSTNPSILHGLSDPSRREEAWREFLARYQPIISGWCLRRGLNHTDAEDITAKVLSKLVTRMCGFRYDPRHRFRGWLKTVVENEVRELWRGWRRRPWDRGAGGPGGRGGLEGLEGAVGVEELAETLDGSLERDLRLASQVMDRVRARVEPRTWQAFWLTEYEGEAPAAVAQKLGMRLSALYVAKRRVLKILREEGEVLTTAGRE
jgi:RNA polymerase sigma-70 factor (ECF subfamily)